MKKLVLLLLLLASVSILHAQSYNFNSEDNKAYWQMVYESDVDIVSLLTNSGKFDQINNVNGTISSRLVPQQVDLNGRRRGEVPMYLTLSNITAFVRIQQKEGRYRVTVDQINFIGNTTAGLSQQGEQTSLETYALKRDGTFKPMFLNSAAPILDEMFTALFSEQNNLDDEW